MKKLFFILIILVSNLANAEPWIDTRDAWLRADIEYLADIGVIKVPVTTWPLMWASIIKDLEGVDVGQLSDKELKVFKRVKRKGKFETKLKIHNYLNLKVANQGKVLRHFGDDRREKSEVTSRTTGMSKHFAWNIEAARVYDPIDNEENRLDNSYIAGIWGNWVFSAGAIERWWGPGWDTSLILSNNARPVPGISVQRNYSDPFESKWLSWIGPWTFNAFAGQLESDRYIPHAKLLGMSVNFKPYDTLEVGLRRVAQWGGEGRPQSLSNLWNLFIGRDNCDELAGGCSGDRSNEPGNQLAGIDFSWRIPTKKYNGSIYGQLIGEDEAGYLPSRKIYQFGYKNGFVVGDFFVTSYLEYADTENEYAPNITYNNGIYQTGYRTEGYSIGSTYDNDTQSLSLGLLLNHKGGNRYVFRLSIVDMNSDNTEGNHSLSIEAVKFNQVEFKYQKLTQYGMFSVEIEAKDKAINPFNHFSSKNSISVSWTMEL